jgi:hypothetical protein
MKRTALTLMALASLTIAVHAANVTILDPLNLTGVGGWTAPLNTNSGGGNQHQQSGGPIFSFLGNDLPRIIFQRSQFNKQGISYLQIYQGVVTQNQAPPTGSPILIGSSTQGLLNPDNPPDFLIDYGSNSPVAQQVQAFLLTNGPTGTYTIAVVEAEPIGNGNNTKYTTRASFMFNFQNLQIINGKLTPTFNINTQLGSNEN